MSNKSTIDPKASNDNATQESETSQQTSSTTSVTKEKPRKKRGIIRTVGRYAVNTDWRSWCAASEVKTGWRALVAMFKDLAVTPQPKRKESFAEAVKRYNLTEQDLQSRMKRHLFFAGFYLLLAILLFAYTIYMALVLNFVTATFVCIVLTVMALTFAFREHFWYIQVKNRKLGCKLKDWVRLTFGK